jgi:hypothetical protein
MREKSSTKTEPTEHFANRPPCPCNTCHLSEEKLINRPINKRHRSFGNYVPLAGLFQDENAFFHRGNGKSRSAIKRSSFKCEKRLIPTHGAYLLSVCRFGPSPSAGNRHRASAPDGRQHPFLDRPAVAPRACALAGSHLCARNQPEP